MQRRYLTGLLVLAAFVLGLPLAAQAVPVGRFVQVEGSVDLMKGGKFPAVPVKLQDAVEQGDAVRTKSLSRAQIHFVDDTVLTLAPESRVAIDEYVYDAAHSKRQATVEIFRGLVHFVVSKIFQIEKPDFIMKSQTGVLGVRGTRWYAQLTPLSTDIYNEQGTTEVSNLFPEIPGKVTLTGMEFTRVGFNLPPTLPLPITLQDLENLKIQFKNYTGGGGTVSPLETGALGTNPALGPGVGIVGPGPGTVGPGATDPASNPTLSLYTTNNLVNNPANNPLIPPPPPPPGPIYSTYAFTMDLYGYATNTITSLDNANHVGASWGELTETGDAPEYFTTSGSGTRVSAAFTGPVGSAITFTTTNILTGTVSGVSGQSMTGTYSDNWTTSNGYTGTLSGPITINPNGTFSYSYTNLSGSNGTYTVTGAGSTSGTPGTYFTESASGSVAQTGNASGTQQTITNLDGYSIWGTRTGVLPGQFAATLNLTSTAPETGFYAPADQGSFTANMQGVVSSNGSGGYSGVMSTVAIGESGNSNSFAGPVTIGSSGSLSATFYGNNTDKNYTGSGIFSQQGTWTQTAATIPSPSTYSISIPLTDSLLITPTSTTQATVQVEGYGTSSGSSIFPATYIDQVTNGTLSGGSFTVGGGSSTSISGTLTGTVTGVLGGYTLTGTGSYSGTTASGQSINATGPITISPNGSLTFNYTGTLGSYTYTGTLTDSFALPVSQSASGTFQVVSGGDGGNPVLLNTGQMSGSYSVNGGSSIPTYSSLALSYGNGFSLPGFASNGATGSYSVSSAGAVSPNTPWSGGTYGIMGTTVTVSGTSVSQTPMQITYNPANGNIYGQIAVGPGASGSGGYLNAILATTPSSSGLTTMSLYETLNGGYQLTSSSPSYSTGSFTGSGATGTMYLGGSGANPYSNSYSISANLSLTASSQSGAFPALDSGSYNLNMIGAVIGPPGGSLTGAAWGSLNGGSEISSFSQPFSGFNNFTINTGSGTLPATLTFVNSTGNTGIFVTGSGSYPMTVSGTLNQTDPPATGTTGATAPWAAATGLTAPAQAWWLQRAAWLASSQAAAAGAGADPPLLSARFTRLTGTSLGSRIQAAAQLTQFGASGDPTLAANLRAAWRFRREQQHRQAVLRAACGAHRRGPGG